MSKEKLKGLGGWLIFPMIGLFLSIPASILSIVLVNTFPEFSTYGILLSFLYGYLLIFVIIALFSFFKKKKYVPKIMISLYISYLIVDLIISFITKDFNRIIFPLIGGVIWIAYFMRSKRVKNTFIN